MSYAVRTVYVAEDSLVQLTPPLSGSIPASTPGFGAVTQAADGAITYAPNPDFFGQDRVLLKDGNSFTLVNLVVTRVQDAPVAGDDSGFLIHQSTPTDIPLSALLANDTDVDGDLLSVAGVENAVNGWVELHGGHVTFIPTPGYSGAASFDYQVSDGKGGLDTAIVTLTVGPPLAAQQPSANGYFIGGDGADEFDFTSLFTAVTVTAGSGNDVIRGGRGNDRLNGGEGDDRIVGGAGKDIITGGAGADRMAGGADSDTFVIAKGHLATGGQLDHIIDFEGAGNGYAGGGDMLRLEGFSAAATLTFVKYIGGDTSKHVYQVDDGAYSGQLIVQLSGGGGQLVAGDYVFA